MTKSKNIRQVVMRISEQLDKKITRAAKERGLTKASWLRQLTIDTLTKSKEQNDEV